MLTMLLSATVPFSVVTSSAWVDGSTMTLVTLEAITAVSFVFVTPSLAVALLDWTEKLGRVGRLQGFLVLQRGGDELEKIRRRYVQGAAEGGAGRAAIARARADRVCR